MDYLTKFHIDNKYCVYVNKIEGGCVAFFPANYFLEEPLSSLNITYKIKPEGIEYSNNFNSNVNIFHTINYSSRLVILTDIIIKAIQRHIPNNLIIINNNGLIESSLVKILPKLTDDNDVQKAEILSAVYSQILIGLFDAASADRLGIGRGYEDINNLIVSGGLI